MSQLGNLLNVSFASTSILTAAPWSFVLFRLGMITNFLKSNILQIRILQVYKNYTKTNKNLASSGIISKSKFLKTDYHETWFVLVFNHAF